MTESVLALVAGLLSKQTNERIDAAERLARLGAAARPAAVALAKAAGDKDDEVQDWAAAALEELGPPAVGDVEPLTELLADASPDVAYWAATLLGRLGLQGAKAVPALATALSQREELPVRQRAAWALGEVGNDESARAELDKAATDADPRLARLARQGLQKIDDRRKS